MTKIHIFIHLNRFVLEILGTGIDSVVLVSTAHLLVTGYVVWVVKGIKKMPRRSVRITVI